MNSGNKPGQRTWYVGGGDEVPEHTTAFETQSATQPSDAVEDDSSTQSSSQVDSELPTDDIPVTENKRDTDDGQQDAEENIDPRDEPTESSTSGEERAFHAEQGDQATPLNETAEWHEPRADDDEAALDETVADIEATPALDSDDTSVSGEPEVVTAEQHHAVKDSESDSLDPQLFDASAASAHEASAGDNVESNDIPSEQARQSVVEQLQTPIDEKEDTAVQRQSLLNHVDNSSKADDSKEQVDQEDLHWKAPSDEAIEIKRKRDSIDDAIFEGATVRPTVPSRAAAHMWSLLLSLIVIPLAWYLLWDGGTRMMLADGAQWKTGVLDWLALGELIGGCVALFVLILVARWSSLGAFITGVIILAVGVPFVAIPNVTAQRIDPLVDTLRHGNDFAGNVAHHLVWSGGTGFLVMLGVALIALGFVSHGARRKGRKDFLAKRQVEREKRRRKVTDEA